MQNREKIFSKETIKKSRYTQFQDFHNLMQFRVRDILLVSSLYDSFIFEEDGRLYELIRKEYQGLNLSHSPELVQVSSGSEALKMAKESNRFNLIITTLHIDDMTAVQFAKAAKKEKITTPVVLLGYDNREMVSLIRSGEIDQFEKAFMWQGDFRIIIGIIKYLEDKFNVKHDTDSMGVQTILLIEDSIRFYSSYLPLIYTELLKQSQSLLSEGINLSHKFLRMRARPKILLCSSYEEAWEYFKKYEKNLLGVISDIDFLHKGKQDKSAGITFSKEVKKRYPDIPIVLQSNDESKREFAYNIDCSFILKNSPTLMDDVGKFMRSNFSFGDFIFKNEAGDQVERATTLYDLEKKLKKIPVESVVYHAKRNHFSNWLKARTEFWLAQKLRPQKVTEFNTPEELRENIISTIKEYRISRKKSVVSDFNKNNFDKESTFARLGGGSIGGKARGLAFINSLLSNFDLRRNFKNTEIFIPPSLVLGTDVFDEFLELNDLHQFAIKCEKDEEIKTKFNLSEYFPLSISQELYNFLSIIDLPIAIRSSSLLEDSQGQPFAGVYETVMLPNNNENIAIRLKQLLAAIKFVYASTFFKRAKDYISVTPHRLEEEKMAVIIQTIVGREINSKFYPEFSGVAKSINFYPTAPLTAEDGIATVAVGLGKTIVEGGKSTHFCPKFPNRSIQFLTIDDTLKYSQREFYALDFSREYADDEVLSDRDLNHYSIEDAEKDGVLKYTGSTFSIQNNAIYDGIGRSGERLITFAPILKQKLFPLPDILNELLEMGAWGMGSPVEIEFAVRMARSNEEISKFAILQMRPLVVDNELEELDLLEHSDEELICKSNQVLGNGKFNNIKDIVFINLDKFTRANSAETAKNISKINATMLKKERPYLLIGAGRWGSLDPWLGIPVTWEQINGAQAIVEANFKDIDVTPSQGTHFFQNLTSFNIGFFTIADNKSSFVDWQWLKEQKIKTELGDVVHVELSAPLEIKINGHTASGIILKP